MLVGQLRQYGFQAKTEVKFNGGYADIYTNWQGNTIIEIKKYLTRKTIYEAFGQLNLYSRGGDYKLVIAGFNPSDPNEQESSLRIASIVEQDGRVQVLFIDANSSY